MPVEYKPLSTVCKLDNFWLTVKSYMSFYFFTKTNFFHTVVAVAIEGLGFSNFFGYGVQRAQILLAQNKNPPAEFIFDGNFVLVRIYRKIF